MQVRAQVSWMDSLDRMDVLDGRVPVDSTQTCVMDSPTRNGHPRI